MTEIDLDELGRWIPVPLRDEQAMALLESGIVDVRRAVAGPEHEVRAAGRVGAARVATSICGSGPRWPSAGCCSCSAMPATPAPGATTPSTSGRPPAALARLRAVAAGRLGAARRAAAGLPGRRGRTAAVRGRICEAEQLRRRFGRALPVEVRYDDFTTDIAENRILRTAVDRMLALPGISAEARMRLVCQPQRLAEVTSLRYGVKRPAWQPTRLNAHYAPALRLAGIVLDATSVEPLRGPVRVSGLLMSTPELFEDFVTAALGERLTARAGRVVTRDSSRSLDVDGHVRLKPDLVWYDGAQPLAVVDAKYKAEKPAGFPGVDVYQLLAYCTAYGLLRGHLVYATGNEEPTTNRIAGAGVEVIAHTLELTAEPAALLAQVDRLASTIATASQTETHPYEVSYRFPNCVGG